MRVEVLDDSRRALYDDFLKENPHSLFFASDRYRVLLKRFLAAKDHYLLALDEGGGIRAVLPLFISCNDRVGNIVNSLPFYGSNGAVVAPCGEMNARINLIQAYRTLVEGLDCVSSTLITSPFEEEPEVYKKLLKPTFIDERIGQLTPLPLDEGSVEEQLMALYHQKTRNVVRRALKSGLEVGAEPGCESMDFLIQTHQENMNEIGGKGKPDRFFRLIPECFEYGSDYRIYCAYKKGRPAAALLLFYFNQTVEYFTPVIRSEYRADQPLSLLIYSAMADAVRAGFSWWNWGGTWLDQDGVYHFKKHWGTKDKPYYYYINIRKQSILSLSKAELLDEFPDFYVAPFGKLAS